MSFTQNILSSDLLSAFGWTIIHSIWIGGIVFILAWVLMYFFRNAKANYRYLIATGSLFSFLALVSIAFFKVYAVQNINHGIKLTIGENFRSLSNNFMEVSNLSNLTNSFSLTNIENYINQNIPLLVVVWLVGLLFFSLRFAGGLIYTYRMRSRSQKIGGSELNNMLEKMSKKIGLRSKVQIKETSLISTPMVIGFIKPIILLPLGMANGLSLHQVEAILFHEIAHIYRLDYLINLIQSIIEVVLFYHPVVWWLSAYIRAERENICDDIAIKHTGSALNYAKALTNLQELNNQTPDIVVAFSNKKYRFMNRIRRLLGLPLIENNLVEGIISSLLLIVSIVLFTTQTGPIFAQADEEGSINIELPTQLDQDQKKKTEKTLTDDAKKTEVKLVDNQKMIEACDTKIGHTQEALRLKLEKMIQKKSKSGKYDEAMLKELRNKSINQIKLVQKDLEVQKKQHSMLSKELHELTPKLDKTTSNLLNKRLLKNKELLLKTMKKAELATQAFLVKTQHMLKDSQKKTMDYQQKMAYQKQNLAKEQQKKMQYEIQRIQEFQQKNTQFLKQSMEELKKKRQLLKQMQLELKQNEPSKEQKAKLNSMEKELAAHEAKWADKKKITENKLRDMESKLKDEIADMREINEVEEAEMEREIEEVLEVKRLEEEMMEREIEKVAEVEYPEEAEMEMERNEGLRKARQADEEMIKKELAYSKVVKTFAKNLIADGLMKNGQDLEFVLTAKELKIDGKKQTKKLFKKYSKLVADTQGEKLKDGKKFILNF